VTAATAVAKLTLTEAQQREWAVQHVIASTFTESRAGRLFILVAALARIIRSRNGGRALSQVAASAHLQLLSDALTDGDSPGARRYVDLEAENDDLRRQMLYVRDAMGKLLDDTWEKRIAEACHGGTGFVLLYKQLHKMVGECASS